MTFLAPIPALIAGAIALPALLTLYFLKLRRRPVRVSSVALWERALADLQVNVPFRWIRASWLLLLHLLVLLALLAALARPAIETAGGVPDRVYILIDRSASMNATDSPRAATRLDEARERAIEAVDRLARRGFRGEAVVIAFAAEPVTLTPATSDLGEIRAAIRAIEPTDEPADLPAAFRVVDALAQAGLTDDESDLETGEDVYAARARVLLFSDGGFSLSAEPATLGNAAITYQPVGPEPETPDAEPGASPNLAVVALAARRDYDDPLTARVFARVQHTGDEPRTVPLTLYAGGERVRTRAVELPAREADGQPGQAAATFELEAPAGALLEVRLPGGDALSSDDSGFAWLPPPRRPSILLVAGDAPSDVAGQMIEDVLRELDPARLDRVGLARYAEITGEPEAAARYDLFVFDRAEPGNAPPSPSLHFGVGVPAEGITLSEPDEPRSSGVATWRRADPLLRDVALDRVRVARPLDVSIASPAADRPVEELASGSRSALILRAEPGGLTRLIVAFDPAQSTWPVEVGFAIFLASAIEQLSGLGDGAGSLALRTGAPATVPIPPELRTRSSMALTGPDGRTREAAIRHGEGAARFGSLSRVGTYRVEGAPSAPPVAVNLFNPEESALRVRTRLTVSGQEVRGAGTERRARAEVGPREIWHWFVLLAVALLAAEWLVYSVKSRVV
ncbi:MAG: VWA domain-containing protein [Phycisphaerales bacterium]|nr:MAG: VWA domain-containing protein [Phycisphaerales bacterium]